MNLVTYQMQGRTPVVCVGQLTSCLAHTEVVFCRCTLLVVAVTTKTDWYPSRDHRYP